MTVGEYGRIAWTGIVALLTIVFVGFVIRLVLYFLLNGVELPAGAANWAFAGALMIFVLWGTAVGVHELRQLNDRWGYGPALALIVLCVSGAVLAVSSYRLIEGSWEVQVSECINGVCRDYSEGDAEEAAVALARFAFVVVVFAASAWWLGTRQRDSRVSA